VSRIARSRHIVVLGVADDGPKDYALSFYCAELCNVRRLCIRESPRHAEADRGTDGDEWLVPMAGSKRNPQLHPGVACEYIPAGVPGLYRGRARVHPLPRDSQV